MRVSWNMGCQVTLWLCQNSYWTSPLLMGKSTINGHFHGKIHYKWPFSWENPLLMVIFNSYFDITRGYPMKVWFRPLHSSWSVRAMWSAQQKLAFSVCFQGRVEIPMVFFPRKNWCSLGIHVLFFFTLIAPRYYWVLLVAASIKFGWCWWYLIMNYMISAEFEPHHLGVPASYELQGAICWRIAEHAGPTCHAHWDFRAGHGVFVRLIQLLDF